MAITFADTHNMIAYLTKSDASEGFDQIIDFLNASSIKYALTVNPNIYVSCIKQFWSSILVRKVNDVMRSQALIDRKKVIITEAIIREALQLDDAESIDCLPNEEIFTELSRMGYEKPSKKLTFYKAFFLPQWKFLINTILQCMSAKRTSWNEFSSSMASAVICLSTGRKINFSMYIFDSLVRNVDSSTKFYMYPRFLQLMNRAQVGDLSSYTTKYLSPTLTQKQANDVADEVATGVNVDDVPAAADVEPSLPSPTPTIQPPPSSQELPSTSHIIPTPPPSPIAKPSSPPQQQQPSQPTHDAKILLDHLYTLLETCTTLTRKVEALKQDKVAQALEIIQLKQRVKKLERKNKLKVSRLKRLRKGEIIANIDTDEDVTLKDVAAVEKTTKIEKDADDDELEPVELKEVLEVVTIAKLMTEVVTAAAATITAATTPLIVAIITAAPSAARRRKRVVIRVPEDTATPSIIIHSESKSKDKRKGIMVEETKPLKKQAQIEQDEAYARELEAELNKNINWDDVIEQVQRKEKEDNVVLRYQAFKRKPQTEAQARKSMMIYLRNMAGFKMDYFKGMSYDDIRLIFKKYFNSKVAFLEKTKEQLEEEESRALKRTSESLEEKAAKKQKLDKEVEELKKHPQIVPNNDDDVYTEATPLALKIVKERFASSNPKNFSDDFLLTTLTYMFEKPDVEAQVWKSQRGIYGLAKVKS
nr:hypothetical protein [Tanacetum cinerariifolium]